MIYVLVDFRGVNRAAHNRDWDLVRILSSRLVDAGSKKKHPDLRSRCSSSNESLRREALSSSQTAPAHHPDECQRQTEQHDRARLGPRSESSNARSTRIDEPDLPRLIKRSGRAD